MPDSQAQTDVVPSLPDNKPDHIATAQLQATDQRSAPISNVAKRTASAPSCKEGRPRSKRARKLTDFAGFCSQPEGRRVPTRLQPWSCGVCTFENKVGG